MLAFKSNMAKPQAFNFAHGISNDYQFGPNSLQH